jgi:organic hydroperoxide reductase OsmC/OhrA
MWTQVCITVNGKEVLRTAENRLAGEEQTKMTARNGGADWRGDIKDGSGTVTVGNGVFQGAYSYGTRFGESAGTNPEQLIAAAQAACFTMALAALLGAAGASPGIAAHERPRPSA